MSKIFVLLALLLSILATIWPYHFDPFRAFQSEMLAVLAFLLIGIAALMKRTRTSVRVSYLLFVLLALLVPLLQKMLGLVAFWQDAFFYSANLLLAAFALICGDLVGDDHKATADQIAARLAFFMIAIGVPTLAICLYQLFGFNFLPKFVNTITGDRLYGNLIQPNHIAFLLLASALGITYFVLIQRIRVGWGLLLLSLFGFVLGGVGSRTTLLALVIISGLMVWMYGVKRRNLDLWLCLLALTFTYSVTLFVVHPILLEIFHDSSTRSLSIGVQSPRVRIWKDLIEALLEKPLTGWGSGQIPVAYSQLDTYPLKTELATDAHNLFLNFGLWFGIPLGALMLFLMFYRFAAIFSLKMDNPSLAIFLGSLALLFVSHGLTGRAVNYTYIYLPALFCVGLMSSSSKTFAVSMLDHKIAIPPSAPRMALVIMLAFTALVWVHYQHMLTKDRYVKIQEAGLPDFDIPELAHKSMIFDNQYAFLDYAVESYESPLDAQTFEGLVYLVQRNPGAGAIIKLLSIAEESNYCSHIPAIERMLVRFHGEEMLERARTAVVVPNCAAEPKE